MKLNLILALLSICLIIACRNKQTQVKGIVYSKHNIPVPNASIYLETYKTSSYPITSTPDIATTNNSGFYQFSFDASKRNSYKVKCISDSGTKGVSISKDVVNDININL